MNLNYQYWYFDGALSNRWCDFVLKAGLGVERHQAYIGEMGDRKEKLTNKDIEALHKKRHSDISWLNEQWIYRMIHPFVDIANRNAGWNYDWDWTESAQFTEYKPGQFYGWHQDCLPIKYDDKKGPNQSGKMRKLSCSILLNHPEEYEGGNLEFSLFNNNLDNKTLICKEARKKGSIIVFPSFCWHQVTEVTRGVRYSLVTWHLGQPWK